MYVFEEHTLFLEDWIQSEIDVDRDLAAGMRGKSVRRLQEWLNLRGYGLSIDEIYGPITAEVVSRFQEDSFLPSTGQADGETLSRMVEPMTAVLRQRLTMSESLGSAVLEYARAHLDKHPHEVGGQNRGPWVRLYMEGHDGRDWLWCAGFVSFILHQATESLNVDMPIPGSFSCDVLASQAKSAGLFVSEDEARHRDIPAGSLFLVRRTSTDWTHVGIVEAAHELHFDTIEGNTNDDGLREGYEVCARSRGYTDKDFILLHR